MSNILDDEMRMLGETVARYVSDRKDATPAASDGDWQELADLGWLSLPYAEEVGGLGFGMPGVAEVMKGHGSGLLRTPYLPFVVLSGGVLARCPNGAERLAEVMAGELRVAPAFRIAGTEREGGAPKLVATPETDGFRINGEDVHVLSLDETDAVLVPALIEASGEIGLFIVSLDTSGLTKRMHTLVDGRSAGHISFADVPVPSTARVDEGIDVPAVLDAVWAEALIAAASENLGAMEQLYEQTLDYAKLRQQFGRPIGSFQSLQFRLVDMWIKLDEARCLVAAAAATRDDKEIASLAAAAWIQTVWSGRLIGEEAIQIHGAIGMTEEAAVGQYVKRVLVNELLFGAPERHLARYRSLRVN
jgi:alkylation response protein AidB-like acyl-CoA dehydrogenase